MSLSPVNRSVLILRCWAEVLVELYWSLDPQAKQRYPCEIIVETDRRENCRIGLLSGIMKQGRPHTESGDVTGSLSQGKADQPPFVILRIAWDYGETGDYRGPLDTTFGILRGRQSIADDGNNEARQSNFRILEDIPCGNTPNK
jgi:hypothetical protein